MILVDISDIFIILLFEQGSVPVAPLYHRIDDWNQRLPQFRNRVLRAGRQFRIDGLGHEAVLYQSLQLQVKYTGRGFGEYPVQLARAERPVPQLVQNAGLPF